MIKITKVLIIAIDALDSTLLSKFERDLPHFRKMKEESPDIISRSVFPPDTPTAWASVYTGLNPARHGLVYFLDPLDKVSVFACENIDNSSIRGKTFWDFAGIHGKKVCILFPELGYPVWPVNGVMIARSNQMYGKVAPVQTFPPSLLEKYDLLPLSKVRTTPQEKFLPRYIESYKRLVSAEAEFGLKMWKEDDWDLFFMYSSTLDWLGHNLWRYFDEKDPTYPGRNPYENVFSDFYKLYDGIVGKFIAATNSHTHIMVFSDHGLGMRPVKLVNINEILRIKGCLVSKIKNLDVRDPYYLIEVVKRRLADFVNKYGAGRMFQRVVHTFPALRRVYTSPMSIDWHKTSTYVSDLSGIKVYSYSGIIMNSKNIKNTDYEELRSLLIKELREIKDPESGENLVKWVCRREELYSGEHISKYPDIVFQLRDDYGAGWAIHHNIISSCHTHNIQSGSHRGDSPVFLISNIEDKEAVRRSITLMDIAPTVMPLLGINGNFDFDGKSILRSG